MVPSLRGIAVVRKFRQITLLAGTILMTSQVFAAEELSYGEMVRTKLASGLTNMTFGIAEMPKNIINTSNEVNALFGVTGGVLKGTLHTMGRLLAGGLDFITFPVPSQPITHPTFVWQQFNVDTTYGPYFDMSRRPPPPEEKAASSHYTPVRPLTTGVMAP